MSDGLVVLTGHPNPRAYRIPEEHVRRWEWQGMTFATHPMVDGTGRLCERWWMVSETTTGRIAGWEQPTDVLAETKAVERMERAGAEVVRQRVACAVWPEGVEVQDVTMPDEAPDEGAVRPDLDAIEARAEAATPAPWSRWGSPNGHRDGEGEYYISGPWYALDPPTMAFAGTADPDFIAAARSDVPDLVAYARRLEAELARLQPVVWQALGVAHCVREHGINSLNVHSAVCDLRRAVDQFEAAERELDAQEAGHE